MSGTVILTVSHGNGSLAREILEEAGVTGTIKVSGNRITVKGNDTDLAHDTLAGCGLLEDVSPE